LEPESVQRGTSPTPFRSRRRAARWRNAFDESLRGHDGTVSAREVITYVLTLNLCLLAWLSVWFPVPNEVYITLACCLTAAITSYSFEKR
jgi:hypothetical protein